MEAETIPGVKAVFAKVMSEYLLYFVIVFIYPIIHESIHIVVAKTLGLNFRLSVFKVKRIPIGIGLEIMEYQDKKSILELSYRDRVRYIVVALAPYLILLAPIVLMICSNTPSVKVAGIVLLISSIINIPLELFQPWRS